MHQFTLNSSGIREGNEGDPWQAPRNNDWAGVGSFEPGASGVVGKSLSDPGSFSFWDFRIFSTHFFFQIWSGNQPESEGVHDLTGSDWETILDPLGGPGEQNFVLSLNRRQKPDSALNKAYKNDWVYCKDSELQAGKFKARKATCSWLLVDPWLFIG